MKLSRIICFTLFVILSSYATNAQFVYPVAVTNHGILFGKYKTFDEATHILPDTISPEEAKDIFALNAIEITREKKLTAWKVLKFQMTIIDNGDTTTIKNTGEMLSPEMKERLNKIKSGAKLYFEGIQAGYPNEESTRGIIILAFTVF
jgi:hypothetical protein